MAGIVPVYNAFAAAIALRVSGITTHLGQEFQMDEEAPPRVVWWPGSESIQPAESQGSPSPSPIGNPRRLWVRRSPMEIHIWGANRDANGAQPYEGADIEATENLLDIVVQTLWSLPLTFGVQRELSGSWQNVNGALVKYGALYVLNATLMLPITRQTSLTGAMNTIPATVQIENPATGELTTDVVMNLTNT